PDRAFAGRTPKPAVLEPWARRAVARARAYGEPRGWSDHMIAAVERGLRKLLHQQPAGTPIARSRVQQLSSPSTSTKRLAEVLADLDLLHDDRTDSMRAWIDRRSAELPPGFAGDVRAWLLLLLDGDARHRPRSHSTLYVYLGNVRPFIRHWAATRDHLREVTEADVAEVLDTLTGHRRRNAVTALKSLFVFAKRTRRVFTDPVRKLSVGRDLNRQVLPMTDDEIAAVQQTAVTPAQRLIVALAAVHAARAKPIREIRLDHIDLAQRRITIAGHHHALGDFVREVLLDWLAHRRATWPRTANPHLLVSAHTALDQEPVSHFYLKKHLLLRGVQLEHIRGDRILSEALVTGGDPLHLATMFDLHPTTATAYAGAALNILQRAIDNPGQ
ncbi:MAG: integrase, partial [Saccharothrix sp.]|nr:integrase [Saccharothrix sp.]